jgi:hypothetical protein
MGRALSTVRRKALVGLILTVSALAAWTPPAQAASPSRGGHEVPAVGHPVVTALTPTGEGAKRTPKTPGKPFLAANAAGLAKAKGHAKHAASAPAPSSGTRAGLFNGTDTPGVTAADEGFCCTPPDPTGAIGPNDYVEFINTTIAVFDRSLKMLSSKDMASFVAAPSGLNVSDPQVQWDPRAGRWFYAAIAFASHNNYLVYGWSKTADPTDLNGGWCRFAAFTGHQLADYPKLGHSDNFVLFGANLYDDSTGNYVFTTAVIWTQPKPPAGNLTTCSATGLTAFADPQHRLLNADGTSAFTPVPVNIADASSSGYIVAGHSPVAPLPSDPTGPQTKVMQWHVAMQGGTPHLFADGDLTVLSFDIPASAPQPNGAPQIDTLDARLTQAVAHADPDAGGAEAIWTQHTIDGPGGRSVARWYEILPATKTVRQQGAVQSATDFIWNASISPSIAGNDAAVFYNRGSATNLAVAAALSRTSATPLSTLNAGELVLATSTAEDVDFSCSSPYGPPCRWGDYSGASPDPTNAGVVWGTNQVSGQSFFGFPQWVTQNYAVTTNGSPPPKCTSVTWNPASPVSPSAPGTRVTLSATAAGCPNPLYQFWYQAQPNGTWTIIQPFGTASTATWNTTGLAAGTYNLDVWVKQQGSTADFEAEVKPYTTYTLQAANVCTSVTWNPASPASPAPAGTQVGLSATAAGCTNPLYQFWYQAQPNGTWTIIQPFGTASTATWNTSGLAAGTYNLDVWVKQQGSSATFDAETTPYPTYTLQPPPACTSVTWNPASPASPSAPGTQITLSATAAGCPNPLYQFWYQAQPNGTWTIIQPFGTASTATWNTSGLAAGTYNLDVWVKQQGSSATFDAEAKPYTTYTLQAPNTCTSVTWNPPSPTSPQAPGAQVTLSGTAAGCSNPTYEFWVQAPGGQWTILQGFSTSSSYAWNTTGLATGTYLFDIWVRQSGSSAQYEAHILPNPTYTLQTGAPCTSVTLAFSPGSPQAPGTQITLNANASGCPNPTYEFWIQAPGGSWNIVQSWSSNASYVWNTGGASTGTYLFDVWVRQAGSGAQYEAHLSPNPTYALQTGPPCTSVTLTFNPVSPQHSGASVQLNAAATGCPDATYEFWIQAPGGQWTIVQGYSTSSTFTWNTSGLAPGTYLFDVWVREAGSTAQYEAHISPNPSYTLN